ncbi:putative D,D-dipeptide transport ATP-binding protein DdpD [uncultured Comamonas sp.]|nr:putative D,D-dipeptide transport ATP-binding protein DdpD [uncultured Comamonas sp.]
MVMVMLEAARLNLLLPAPGGRRLHALRDIGFQLQRGSCLGVVGESGSGKSLLALSLLGLAPGGSLLSGHLRLDGQDILGQSEAAWQRLRGNRMAMVFQDPGSALNPVHPIGAQVAEPLRRHQGLGRRAALAQAADLLAQVGIARQRLGDYPHQFSGGQRQRITIAMALACAPDVLIADEPTTALDTTVQQHILDLLHRLVEERAMALLLISHDLGVIAQHADDILVMYGGQIVESGPTAALFRHMAHPYSRALLAARPRLGAPRQPSGRPYPLMTIPGQVPSLADWGNGCPFANRCGFAQAECQAQTPPRIAIPSLCDIPPHSSLQAHHVWCLRPEALQAGSTQRWQE